MPEVERGDISLFTLFSHAGAGIYLPPACRYFSRFVAGQQAQVILD